MKRFACNERGFLLMEHLLGLVITSILATTAVLLMQTLRTYQVNPVHLSQHEVETLATRLQIEAAFADSLTARGNQIILEVDGNQVSYLWNNQRISRQVNGRGGEIALYNVAEFRVFPGNDRSIRAEITSFADITHELYLVNFHREVQNE